MKDKLVLNRVWNKTSQQFFLLKLKVDWSGCSRLLREKRGKGDPAGAPRRLPDRPRKASA
ncbi:hypothetical protein GCM10009597_03020 [Peribacillus frigoritolerans]